MVSDVSMPEADFSCAQVFPDSGQFGENLPSNGDKGGYTPFPCKVTSIQLSRLVETMLVEGSVAKNLVVKISIAGGEHKVRYNRTICNGTVNPNPTAL